MDGKLLWPATIISKVVVSNFTLSQVVKRDLISIEINITVISHHYCGQSTVYGILSLPVKIKAYKDIPRNL